VGGHLSEMRLINPGPFEVFMHSEHRGNHLSRRENLFAVSESTTGQSGRSLDAMLNVDASALVCPVRAANASARTVARPLCQPPRPGRLFSITRRA
jgi:hypothetical protein